MNRKRIRKKHPDAVSRRGSALLLTLAVLALLLIIAIFFAFDAQLSQRLSENYQHSTQARLLHECGINRALAFIDDFEQFRNFSELRGKRLFLYPAQEVFAEGSGEWDGIRVFPLFDNNPTQEGLSDAFNARFRSGSSAASWALTSDSISSSVFDSATWDSVVSGNVALGQFTFLIIDETGKVDPGYLSNATTFPKTRFSNISITDFSTGFTDSLVIDSCFSYAHLALAGSPDQDSASIIRQFLFPGTLPVNEEFWFDANGDSSCSDSEIFQRLDITELDSSISAQQLYAFLLTGDSSTAITSDVGKDSSLWLQGVRSLNSANTIDARRYAAQLVANIWDYQDTDSETTIMYVSNSQQIETLSIDSLTDMPVSDIESIVYGVESGLALTGVTLDLKAEYNGSTDTELQGTLGLQLYNPFGATIDTVFVVASMEVTMSDLTGTDTFPVDWSMEAPCNDSYIYLTDSIVSQKISLIASGGDNGFSLDTVKINFITLVSDGDLTTSYPRIVSNSVQSTFATWEPNGRLSGSTGDEWHAAVKANESSSVDLLMISLSPDEDIAGTYWTTNQSTSPVIGFLSEEHIVETAFSYSAVAYGQSQVRNGQISTLGDLGRVHSPHFPNRSVQFWSQDFAPDHDAYLLDMFSTDTSPKAKVNINTTKREIVNGLLWATDLYDAGFVSYWLLYNGAETDGGGTKWGNPLTYRGDLHQFFKNPDPAITTGKINDPTQHDQMHEDAIGNFVELLDTRQNYFTIIACGRSIEDVGYSDAPHRRKVQIGSTPARYGIVRGTYKTITAVYRDAWGLEKPRILRTTVLEE